MERGYLRIMAPRHYLVLFTPPLIIQSQGYLRYLYPFLLPAILHSLHLTTTELHVLYLDKTGVLIGFHISILLYKLAFVFLVLANPVNFASNSHTQRPGYG